MLLYNISCSYFCLPVGSDITESLHEVCRSRRVVHHLSGSADSERVGPVRGCEEPPKRDHNGSSAASVSRQDHAVLLDRAPHHEMGSG